MRKMLVSLIVLAFALMAVTAASASAASTSCEASGTIKLSPGLSATPQIQNITVKGELKNCASVESGVTGGKFIAHLKTAEGVSCAVLSGEGALLAAEPDKVILKWTPHEGGNSTGPFDFPVTEKAGVSLGGLIETGPFAGGAIGGSVSQTYTGGATCGQKIVTKNGKEKEAKKVSKGTFTGSLTA